MPRRSLSSRAAVISCVFLIAIAPIALAGCSTTGSEQAVVNPTGSEFQEGAVPTGGDAQVAINGLETVYFDYDRHVIRSDARPILDSNAKLINDNVGWGTVTIEGHCDERGSEEYNVALGARRADQVKRYLVDLGVSKQRLETVSFGEAAPAVAGASESAFRLNRRSEFKTASK